MSQQVHEETDLYRIEWDRDIGAAIYTWKAFASGETFREGANALLEYLQENDVSRLVVDTSGIRAHDDADQQWLHEEWTPKLFEAGVRASATVHNDSAISKMDMESFVGELDDTPNDLMVTDSLEEAREWVADH